MKTQLLIFLLVCSSVGLFSQQQPDSIQKTKTDFPITLSKNAVSFDASLLFLYVYGSIGGSFNYDHILIKNKENSQFLGVGTGIGYYLTGGENDGIHGVQIPLKLIYLIGGKSSYFETNLGARLIFFDKKIYEYPIINIGYRYQRPKEGLFFKALLGTDGFTLGLGYAF